MNRQTYTVVAVTIEDREGEGLRVYSKDLPGLILSGPRDIVCANIGPAIKALFEHRGLKVASVHAARALSEIINDASPRDVDVHVQHEQFVVEMPAAA